MLARHCRYSRAAAAAASSAVAVKVAALSRWGILPCPAHVTAHPRLPGLMNPVSSSGGLAGRSR